MGDGKKMVVDISSTKKVSYGRNKNWTIVQDLHTNMCWSYLLKKRYKFTAVIRAHIDKVKEILKKTDIVRYDGSG